MQLYNNFLIIFRFFLWNIPVGRFTFRTYFGCFLFSCNPFMIASFTLASHDGDLFYCHKDRIVILIFKITHGILSKVRFIYTIYYIPIVIYYGYKLGLCS